MADNLRITRLQGVVNLHAEPIRIRCSLRADDDLQRVFVCPLGGQQTVDKVVLRATHLAPFVTNNQQGTRSHRCLGLGTHGAIFHIHGQADDAFPARYDAHQRGQLRGLLDHETAQPEHQRCLFTRQGPRNCGGVLTRFRPHDEGGEDCGYQRGLAPLSALAEDGAAGAVGVVENVNNELLLEISQHHGLAHVLPFGHAKIAFHKFDDAGGSGHVGFEI